MSEEAATRELAPEPALPARGPHICIAIPTFKRPESLERLLGGVARLEVPAGAGVRVLVLDNDPVPSVRALVEHAAASFPFELAYRHVAEPGLSSVRNAALAQARQDCDFVAMIDDDELPHPRWLAELVRVQQSTRADAVVGPVPRLVPEAAPRWLRAGGFFDLPVYPDMSFIRDGYSGNCLLRLESIERLGLAFDTAFNFAGGEDLLFFRQLRARGATLAYARHAVAEEFVGSERLSAAYVLKLNFRRGNTLALCDRRLGGLRLLAVRAIKAPGRIALGSAKLVPFALGRGRTGVVAALCDVALGLGALAGLFGITYHAYGRPVAPRG